MDLIYTQSCILTGMCMVIGKQKSLGWPSCRPTRVRRCLSTLNRFLHRDFMPLRPLESISRYDPRVPSHAFFPFLPPPTTRAHAMTLQHHALHPEHKVELGSESVPMDYTPLCYLMQKDGSPPGHDVVVQMRGQPSGHMALVNPWPSMAPGKDLEPFRFGPNSTSRVCVPSTNLTSSPCLAPTWSL